MLWNKPLSFELSWLKCTKLVAATTLLTNVSCSPGHLIISPHNRIVSSVLFSLNSCTRKSLLHVRRLSVLHTAGSPGHVIMIQHNKTWFHSLSYSFYSFSHHAPVLWASWSQFNIAQLFLRISSLQTRAENVATQAIRSPGHAIMIEHSGFPGRWIQSIRWLLCRLLGQLVRRLTKQTRPRGSPLRSKFFFFVPLQVVLAQIYHIWKNNNTMKKHANEQRS